MKQRAQIDYLRPLIKIFRTMPALSLLKNVAFSCVVASPRFGVRCVVLLHQLEHHRLHQLG